MKNDFQQLIENENFQAFLNNTKPSANYFMATDPPNSDRSHAVHLLMASAFKAGMRVVPGIIKPLEPLRYLVADAWSCSKELEKLLSEQWQPFSVVTEKDGHGEEGSRVFLRKLTGGPV